jgi:hypothetical protein
VASDPPILRCPSPGPMNLARRGPIPLASDTALPAIPPPYTVPLSSPISCGSPGRQCWKIRPVVYETACELTLGWPDGTAASPGTGRRALAERLIDRHAQDRRRDDGQVLIEDRACRGRSRGSGPSTSPADRISTHRRRPPGCGPARFCASDRRGASSALGSTAASSYTLLVRSGAFV